MNATTQTPGPLVALPCRNSERDGWRITRAEADPLNHADVVALVPAGPNASTNAAVLAAAPDLLAALRRCERLLSQEWPTRGPTADVLAEVRPILSRLAPGA